MEYRNIKLQGKDTLDRKGFKIMLLVFRNEYIFSTTASFLLHTAQTVKFIEIPITKYLWSQEHSGMQNKIKH